MKNNEHWSRRRFSKAVLSAQTLLATGFITVPIACADTKKTEVAGAILNNSQQETLKFAMDEIIPANAKMPSASDIGSVTYVLKILEELPGLSLLFSNLALEIENQSLQYSNTNFPELKKLERIAILTNLEETKPELFKVLKDFTYESYYTNDKVYELIRYEAHPTGTSGPKMEAFDKQLLNRVRQTPPMYTKI